LQPAPLKILDGIETQKKRRILTLTKVRKKMDMITALKHCKIGTIVPPQIKDNGAFANNTYFDCDGVEALLVILAMGATDIAMGSTDAATPPYLEECDTAGGTYTKITGSDLSAVIGAGDDDKRYGWFIDRRKTRKRFVRINAPTAGDGTAGVNAAAIVIGFPVQQAPINATQMGLTQLVEL
jgi:hypothetical protein